METDDKDTSIAIHEETKILYESRSAEVNEIIGTMPPWITRWGTTVIGLFIVLIFFIANYITLPVKVGADIYVKNLSGQMICKGQIHASHYSKVKIGQSVLVRLDAFPEHQFGIMTGKIVSIDNIISKGNYSFTINLIHNIDKVKAHMPISAAGFYGTAEIVVEEKSVLTNLLDNLPL